ncbi:MAG: PUR family DNA/RNA-binding protein [Prolixibacteraceae bacterium]|nr:PUR family DNA/RNA-binding protein [Prolixibacteraceae bacterium]
MSHDITKKPEKKDFEGSKFRQEIYSKAVRAGKRTYFFDVKSTRKGELYLTITESKKRFDKQGNYFFEKHKIFLYKEDFDKFSNGLEEIIEYINEHQPDEPTETIENNEDESTESSIAEYSNIDFEDLNN